MLQVCLNNRLLQLTMGQASVRALAIGTSIDLGCRYKDQSITKLAKLMLAVSAWSVEDAIS